MYAAIDKERPKNILVLGLTDNGLLPFLLEVLGAKTIIRKLSALPTEEKLSHESGIAKKNYDAYGLETIFILPDNKFIKSPRIAEEF